MPWAAGTADADHIPNTPQMASRARPELANPAPKHVTEKRSMDPMNMLLRPKISAILPKNNSNAPAVNLLNVNIVH